MGATDWIAYSNWFKDAAMESLSFQNQIYSKSEQSTLPVSKPEMNTTERFCGNCGKPISPNQLFCVNCGSRI